jgi:hypothetical protein
VIAPVVLLKIETASPSANVAFGIVIEPPEPTCTYSPTSEVARVYEPVLVPTGGMFLNPRVEVMSGKVIVVVPATAAALSVDVPLVEPFNLRFPELKLCAAVKVCAASEAAIVKVASGTVTVRLADGEAEIVDTKLVDPPLIAIAIVYTSIQFC